MLTIHTGAAMPSMIAGATGAAVTVAQAGRHTVRIHRAADKELQLLVDVLADRNQGAAALGCARRGIVITRPNHFDQLGRFAVISAPKCRDQVTDIARAIRSMARPSGSFSSTRSLLPDNRGSSAVGSASRARRLSCTVAMGNSGE